MRIREAYITGTQKLKRVSGPEAALEAELLLAHLLGISRERLIAHDNENLRSGIQKRFKKLLNRRMKHEPLAYLIGEKEFFGLPFTVTPHTLIPRPETELMVETALAQIVAAPGSIIADVGTGSGAIAIALAKHSKEKIFATDISAKALTVAKKNAKINGVADRITFRKGNLLAPLMRSLDANKPIIITANLPYLNPKQWKATMPEVRRFEPKSALVSGKDGLDCYRELFTQLMVVSRRQPMYSAAPSKQLADVSGRQPKGFSASGGMKLVICEIDPSQKKAIVALAKKAFPEAVSEIKKDLSGKARFALFTFL